MTEKNKSKAIPYNELIPSSEEFTGDKFKKVLQSHGLTVTSGENNTKLIKLNAHGEYPDIYINVPFAGHNFDKYVFSETAENNMNANIKNRPIERRLQYLNSILINSGYVGEKITLDMLNSREPLNLSPGIIAIKELEQYNENIHTRLHSAEFFFNNPTGKQEREKDLEKRTLHSMQIAEEALMEYNGMKVRKVSEQSGRWSQEQRKSQKNTCHSMNSTMRITAIIGGKTINLSFNAQEQQKLMAIDGRQRIKFLDKMLDETVIGKMSRESKAELQQLISDKLFSNPSIFSSHVANTENYEQHVPKQNFIMCPSAIAAANYEAERNHSDDQGQEISTGLGR